MSDFLSERRLNLLDQVLSNRTRYVTVLLEDIFQSQNASAVLRTSECMGLQDVHVIENRNQYLYNPEVGRGAGKWINLHRYSDNQNNTLIAIEALKANGYRIVATMPGNDCTPLNEFDVTKGKFAIVIGNEKKGISQDVIKAADEFLTIPMYGFTESYNLSVSTAIILHQVIGRLRASDVNWRLSVDEKNTLKQEWLQASIKKSELLVEQFYSV
ncbi:MAG: RNA methyltransferase [Bacteroidota bacterium]|nr:RNA methyltransferase [Bacteroidota bacterium]